MYFLTFYISVWCPIPSVTNGGIVKVSRYINCSNTHCRLNAVIATRCDPNYILKGYGLLRCARYGQWHQPIPTCEGKFPYGLYNVFTTRRIDGISLIILYVNML